MKLNRPFAIISALVILMILITAAGCNNAAEPTGMVAGQAPVETNSGFEAVVPLISRLVGLQKAINNLSVFTQSGK